MSEPTFKEVTFQGKTFALVPLCMFHDMPSEDRSERIKEQFGLIDHLYSYNLFEITDRKKLMMLKLKYGID